MYPLVVPYVCPLAYPFKCPSVSRLVASRSPRSWKTPIESIHLQQKEVDVGHGRGRVQQTSRRSRVYVVPDVLLLLLQQQASFRPSIDMNRNDRRRESSRVWFGVSSSYRHVAARISGVSHCNSGGGIGIHVSTSSSAAPLATFPPMSQFITICLPANFSALVRRFSISKSAVCTNFSVTQVRNKFKGKCRHKS